MDYNYSDNHNENNEILIKIHSKLEEILSKQILLETKLEKLEEIEHNTKRMEEHINFIEKTYDTVKTPFHYLMTKVNTLSYPSLLFKTTEKDDRINYESNV